MVAAFFLFISYSGTRSSISAFGVESDVARTTLLFCSSFLVSTSGVPVPLGDIAWSGGLLFTQDFFSVLLGRFLWGSSCFGCFPFLVDC